MAEKDDDQSGQHIAGHQINVTGDAAIGQIGDHIDTAGGDYVARDKIVYQGLSTDEVTALFLQIKHEEQPLLWNGINPFPGLRAFQETDEPYFFGRESLVSELLERVERSRFIVISGPSGSGKSSVARAGLLHALRRGKLDGSQNWLLATMSPQGNPMAQLALAMQRATKAEAIGEQILAGADDNAQLLAQAIEIYLSDDRRQRCLLLVDQFEETFTQTKDPSAQAAFIDLLTGAVQPEGSRMIVVLSMRSDFVSHCVRFPALREMLSRQFQLVGAMEPPDLAKAISLPAMEVGAEIEAALVSRIMEDMKGEPGALPLMSFALRDLFEAEKTKTGQAMDLTLREYLDRGGIEEALERHANKVFATFSAEQQDLAKNIFSRLIEVGQGRADTRRTAAMQELVPVGQDGAQVAAVISALAQENVRLITTKGVESGAGITAAQTAEASVTIAHEKLIDAWPWLRRLVDENREIITLQNQIHDQARLWAGAEDEGYLYRGGQLAQVEEKLAVLQPGLDDLSQRFIAASIAEREAEEQAEAERIRQQEALKQERASAGRFRRLTRWLALAAAIAIIATIIATIFLFAAREQQSIAEDAKSTAELGATSESQARGTADAANATAQIDATRANENAKLAAANEAVAITEAIAAAESEVIAKVEAERANWAEATAVVAQVESEQQRQIMSLMAQSQSLMNDSAPEDSHVVQARLMAVAAEQIDQSSTGGKNSSFLRPWIYQLTRELTAPFQALIILDAHQDWVESVAWNMDSTLLASASSDHTILIWDTKSWQIAATLTDHEGIVEKVAWNKDGTLLASASTDRTVIIWDTESWLPLSTLRGGGSRVNTVAWSKDGSRLASSYFDGSIIIWDTENWQPLTTLSQHESNVGGLSWNADGSRLASAASDSTIIIWDTESWQPLATLPNATGYDNVVAWNGDGSRLASATNDDTIIIWNTESWQPVTSLAAHKNWVIDVAWNSDDTRLASASETAVIIWDTENWKPLITLTDHTRSINSVDWNGDGSRLASGSSDKRIIIWDTESWQPQIPLSGHTGPVNAVDWNADGTLLATASADSTVIIWDTESRQPLATLTGHTGEVISVAWNGDDTRLASASGDHTVLIWDTESWQPLTSLTKHTGWVNDVAWSEDNSRLASASDDGTVIIWETEKWQPLITLDDHRVSVQTVAWNSDGTRLASGSGSEGGAFANDVIIWNTVNWSPLLHLTEHTDWIHDVAWNGDGSLLASASGDDTIIIWDTENWQPLATLADHERNVFSVAWNADGSRLASTSDDDSVIIWDSESWQPLISLTDHKTAVLDVAWNADGSRLASASEDNTILITKYEEAGPRNCDLARRNLTWGEWQMIFPDDPYRLICDQWPVHPSVPAEEKP